MTTHYEDIQTILNRIDGVSNEASTINRQKLRAGMNLIENIQSAIDDTAFENPDEEAGFEELMMLVKELNGMLQEGEYEDFLQKTK